MADNTYYGSAGTSAGAQGYDSQGYYDSQGNYISYNSPPVDTPPTNPNPDNQSFYNQATDTANVAPYATDNSTAPIGDNWTDGGAALAAASPGTQLPTTNNPIPQGSYTVQDSSGTTYVFSGHALIGAITTQTDNSTNNSYLVYTPSDGGSQLYVTNFRTQDTSPGGLQYLTDFRAYNSLQDAQNSQTLQMPQGDLPPPPIAGPQVDVHFLPPTTDNVSAVVTASYPNATNQPTQPPTEPPSSPPTEPPAQPAQQTPYDPTTDPYNGFYQAFMQQNWAGVPYQPWVMRWDVPAQQQPNNNGNQGTPQNNNNTGVQITTNQLQRIFPHSNANTRQAVANALNQYGGMMGLTTNRRMAQFLGQMGQETGGLRTFRESLNYTPAGLRNTFGHYFGGNNPLHDPNDYGRNADHAANQPGIANIVYGGRMGNINQGDGWNLRGGGGFQLTGRTNYQAFTDWYDRTFNSDLNFVTNPDLLRDDPNLATLSAMWYYSTRVRNPDNATVEQVTRNVNGGLNGLAGRQQYFNNAMQILNH